MSYKYEVERENIFTDKGLRDFIKVRDRVFNLLKEAGAFKMVHALKDIPGDSWTMMACVDKLVELGEIKEITTKVAGQDRIFVSAEIE